MSFLTSATGSGINNRAAVAATRGDLGQLAPRKKLLKSFSSFLEDFLRPSEHFGTEGFSFLPPCCPNRIPRTRASAAPCLPLFAACTDLELLAKGICSMSTNALHDTRSRE